MTKEQYLQLKKEQKERASRIRKQKPLYRAAESNQTRLLKLWCQKHPGKQPWKFWYSNEPEYLESIEEFRKLTLWEDKKVFRYIHIFLCLLRGRSRKQIENNFYKREFSQILWEIEYNLKKLCEKYDLKYKIDKHGVIKDTIGEIERPWVKKNTPIISLISKIKAVV